MDMEEVQEKMMQDQMRTAAALQEMRRRTIQPLKRERKIEERIGCWP
jgi:hypothetical protein|tara:strand:+ start:262 stop:402 length:141 start_codon:yes stop_codon:yes gene_type:complete